MASNELQGAVGAIAYLAQFKETAPSEEGLRSERAPEPRAQGWPVCSPEEGEVRAEPHPGEQWTAVEDGRPLRAAAS